MSREEKGRRGATGGPMRDPEFMKKFQAMFDEGDCAQMMSRMMAMCCGPPEQSEGQGDSSERRAEGDGEEE